MSASNNHPATDLPTYPANNHTATDSAISALSSPLVTILSPESTCRTLLSISLSFGRCLSERQTSQVGLNLRGRFPIRREARGPTDCQAIPTFGSLWVLPPLSEAYGSDDVIVHTTFLLLLPAQPPQQVGFWPVQVSRP